MIFKDCPCIGSRTAFCSAILTDSPLFSAEMTVEILC